jgi:hypothetical protein
MDLSSTRVGQHAPSIGKLQHECFYSVRKERRFTCARSDVADLTREVSGDVPYANQACGLDVEVFAVIPRDLERQATALFLLTITVMSHMKELRSSPRVPFDRFIVQVRGSERVVSGNLSMGGVGFALRSPVRAGESIGVRFRIDTGEFLEISAVICHVGARSDGQFYAGARFIDVDVLVQNPLERFFEELSLSSSIDLLGTPNFA